MNKRSCGRFGRLACVALVAVGLSASVFSPPSAKAADQVRTSFGGPGIDWGTNIHYYVTTVDNNGGAPRFTFLAGASDKAASVVQFYKAGAPNTLVSNAASGTATFYVTTNAGYAITTNDIVVVRCKTNDYYQRLQVATATLNSFTTSSNLTYSLATGDTVWEMTAHGKIRFGSATNSISNAAGVYNGLKGKPTLVELDTSNVGSLDVVSGVFEP